MGQVPRSPVGDLTERVVLSLEMSAVGQLAWLDWCPCELLEMRTELINDQAQRWEQKRALKHCFHLVTFKTFCEETIQCL